MSHDHPRDRFLFLLCVCVWGGGRGGVLRSLGPYIVNYLIALSLVNNINLLLSKVDP